MNENQTEIMVFVSSDIKLLAPSIAVGGESQPPVGQVRNLCMTLEVHLTMEAHIQRVCQFSYLQLKTIRTVQHAL